VRTILTTGGPVTGRVPAAGVPGVPPPLSGLVLGLAGGGVSEPAVLGEVLVLGLPLADGEALGELLGELDGLLLGLLDGDADGDPLGELDGEELGELDGLAGGLNGALGLVVGLLVGLPVAQGHGSCVHGVVCTPVRFTWCQIGQSSPLRCWQTYLSLVPSRWWTQATAPGWPHGELGTMCALLYDPPDPADEDDEAPAVDAGMTNARTVRSAQPRA
jgi:hypothetical protein